MESAPHTPAPAYSAQNATRALAAARPQDKDKAEPATTFLFYGYLFMILLEYTGIPNDFPVLKAVRATTVLNFGLFVLAVARIGFGDLMKHRQSKIVLAFIIFTAMSVIWAVVRVRAFNEIRPFVDYAIFFVLTVLLVDRQKRFDMLSWTLLIVATVLVARNLDKLSSSMRLGGFRASYFMGDNNDFAWGCVVMMPIILNLAFGTRSLFTRLAGLGGALICIVGIIGSGSRGGTLGLGAAILFYWLVMSQHKARGALGVIVVALGVLAFAPASYFQRMGTVSTYEEDNSAKGRLQVWGASIRMATDRPLGVGAGNFSAAYGRFYMPAHSNMAWGGQRWLSAHSIYFRVLGEYGFIGLGMLLWLIITNIRDNIAVRRRLLAATAPAIPATWPALVNMGVIGFAVCGTFLGGITYPHLFMLSGLTIVAKRYVASLDPPPPVAPKGRRR